MKMYNGGGTPCTERLGESLEYDFGTFWGPQSTSYSVLGGWSPPLERRGIAYLGGGKWVNSPLPTIATMLVFSFFLNEALPQGFLLLQIQSVLCAARWPWLGSPGNPQGTPKESWIPLHNCV